MIRNLRNHLLLFVIAASITAAAQSLTSVSQMESLSRGVVAIHKVAGGNFISWRLLGTDSTEISFDVLRNNEVIAENLKVCNYTDVAGKKGSKYRIVCKSAGSTFETSEEVQVWSDEYKTMTFERPEGGKFYYADSIVQYSYYVQEASVADADADGEYEIVVKWNPTSWKDNATDGFTGNTILDGYHLNPAVGNEPTPERLWRIDLGRNIRSGSHYTQFLFYDFNGDGRAELICKTAPGSKDGEGRYVTEAADDEAILATDNTKDYRTKTGRVGHIMSGPEFLTVFDGLTGRALHTVWYNPNRGFTTGKASSYGDWGDDYGNRGDRFLACAAYLAGPDKPASAVMCRGYYTRSYLWAVDFDGKKLKQRWLHGSISKTTVELTDSTGHKVTKHYSSNTTGIGNTYTAYGQGCHSIAVGDVDGDGCDEIMYGAAAIDNDGSLLYSTGLGHGDAHHLGDFMPDREGLEFMMPHELDGNGWHVRDAATGEMLIHKPANVDNGRGMTADVDPLHRGAEFWSVADYSVYNTEGEAVATGKNVRPAYCFRVYWDGTYYDNLLDGSKITTYDSGTNNRIYTAPDNSIKNGSKAYPVLSADLFGDWREEVIWCSSTDSCTINICSTTSETRYAVPTLMHDHLYRMSVVWQNVAYNQPPHLSYYLPDLCKEQEDDNTSELTDDEQYLFVKWANEKGASFTSELDNIETITSSDATVYLELADFAGHSLNDRFAFNATKTNVSLDPLNGLKVNLTTKNMVSMSVLSLRKGDRVTIDWDMADASQGIYITSANVKYTNTEGKEIELTKTGKTAENCIYPTDNTDGFAADGLTGKARHIFTMTANGTLDIYQGSTNSTLRVSYVGIKSAGSTVIRPIQKDAPRWGSEDIYDLQGRKVSKEHLKKGIYLQGGRKITVRQ